MANDRLYLRHRKSGEKMLLGTYGGGDALLLQPHSLAEVQQWMVAHLVDFGEIGRTLGFASPFDLIVEAQLRGRYSADPLDLLALSDARGEVEKLKADNARLRKLIADVEDNGACDNSTVRVCPWCQLTVATSGHQRDPDGCPAFAAPGVVR